MSFEGYYEYLCKNGHRNGNDVYDPAPEKCQYCGEEFVITNLVDQTNDDGFNDMLKLEQVSEGYWACEDCGCRKVKQVPAVYKIPKEPE